MGEIVGRMDLEIKEVYLIRDKEGMIKMMEEMLKVSGELEEEEGGEYEELFFQWVESAVELDKKEYSSHPHYGLTDPLSTISIYN